MIEINLIPEELKVKAKGKNLFAGFNLKYAVYGILSAFAFLILIHLLLGIVGLFQVSQLRSLESKWKGLGPGRQRLEEFNKQYSAYSQDAALVKQLTEQRINWPEKLNRLSLDLPSGIWLTELSVSPREFFLRAAVLSQGKMEMSIINRLIDALKNDAKFLKGLGNLELGPLQSKSIAGYDVTEFTLRGALKIK